LDKKRIEKQYIFVFIFYNYKDNKLWYQKYNTKRLLSI